MHLVDAVLEGDRIEHAAKRRLVGAETRDPGARVELGERAPHRLDLADAVILVEVGLPELAVARAPSRPG